MSDSPRTNRPVVLASAAEVFLRYLLVGWLDLLFGLFSAGLGTACYAVWKFNGIGVPEFIFCGLFAGLGLYFLGRLGWRAGLAGFVAWRGQMIEATVISIVKDPRSLIKGAKALKYLFLHPKTREKFRGIGPSLRAREITRRVWRTKDKIIVAYLPRRPQWSVILSREPFLRPARPAPTFTPRVPAGGEALRETLLAPRESTSDPVRFVAQAEEQVPRESAITTSSAAEKTWKTVKVLVLGARAVGKTTFAGHFETSISEATGKSAGVRVSKARVRGAEGERAMMIWDVDGQAPDALRRRFSAGTGGFVVLSDATRPTTQSAALALLAELAASFPKVPAVLFENHRGLPGTDAEASALPPGVIVQSGSAQREGDVLAALRALHEEIARGEQEP